MANYFNISFIGSGNVAWHLAQACEDAGHSVGEVYSRTIKNAKALCEQLYDSAPTDHLDFSESKSSIFILAVPDKFITYIAERINLPAESILVHTSGSEPIESIRSMNSRAGVFYPVQTFSKKRKINFNEVPICIEAEEKGVEKILVSLAKTLTRNVHLLDSHQRKVVHISAIFANNFTNHLLTISKGLTESVEIDFSLLKPLLIETIQKSLQLGPEHAQTGPAIRQDFKTIQSHLELLKDEPFLQELYKLLSEDIIRMHQG